MRMSCEMHIFVNYVVYLECMSSSTLPTILLYRWGIWGNISYIKWLSRWLETPICLLSKTQRNNYLHFNSSLDKQTFGILFHHEIHLRGHFEPFMSNIRDIGVDVDMLFLSCIQQYGHKFINSTQVDAMLFEKGFKNVIVFKSYLGGSSFITFCN